jgi:choice-of-anchor C domain-containing protein
VKCCAPLIAAAAGLLIALPASAAGNLLVNGSFEIGPDPGLFLDLPSGSTALPGWVVGDFHVDYVGPALWIASDGQRALDMDGSVGQPHNGAISQSFATTPGQGYRVSFDMSANIWGAPLVKQMEVSAAGASQVFSYDIGAIAPFVPPAALDWHHETFLFTATASTTTLTFRSLSLLQTSTPDHGPALDNVRVEPTVWKNLGFALPGVAGPPQLLGSGELGAGSIGSLVLTHAAPSAPALMFIALGGAPTPFKGGLLVPVPALAKLAVTTSGLGTVPLIWPAWPSGLSGLSLYFQYAVKDLAAVHDVSLSNALRADVP